MAEALLPEKWRIELRTTLSSTQDEVRRQLETGNDVHGLVVRAEVQTRGQGRQEREWQSAAGGSYQTVSLRDPSEVLRSGRVPIAVAVGIAEALSSRGIRISLKWPNDLYLPPAALPVGKVEKLPGKLGGILCQYVRGHLLIGVGINVRNQVPPGGAALSALTADEVSELVLQGVRSALTEALADPHLPTRFSRFDLLEGSRVKVAEGQRQIEGVAAGIDEDGCFRVRTGTTTIKTCGGRIVEIDTAAP